MYTVQTPISEHDKFWFYDVKPLEKNPLAATTCADDSLLPDQIVENLTLSDCRCLKEVEPEAVPHLPVLEYIVEGAVSFTTKVFENFIEPFTDEIDYKIRGRNLSRTVPLCRGGMR